VSPRSELNRDDGTGNEAELAILVARLAQAGIHLSEEDARRLLPGAERIRRMANAARRLLSPGAEPFVRRDR
jgi:hypothetical protein